MPSMVRWAASSGVPRRSTASTRYVDHSRVLMPIIACVAPSGHGTPSAAASPRRTTSHSSSESVSVPSMSKITASMRVMASILPGRVGVALVSRR